MSEKEVKGKQSFNEMVFFYGAIGVGVIGFIWAILAAAADSEGALRAAGFFQGFFFTVLGGLVLYGLSIILKGK